MAVAVDIGEERGFAKHAVGDKMLFPAGIGLGGLGRAGGGVMTAAERRAVLDGQLEKSYGTFDGMIIAERQKAEAEANEAGSQVMGTGGGGGEGAEGEGAEGAEEGGYDLSLELQRQE